MEGDYAILVVDDDESMLEFCSTYLTLSGYRVKSAANGAEALAHLSAEPFAVVLTDHVTVDADGTSILQAAKELQPRARVLMMSGIPTLAEASKSYLAGACDYLAKPFSIERLKLAVERCLFGPA